MQFGLELAVATVGCAVAAFAGWLVLQTMFLLTFGRGK
jgi:hypothetical protein